MAKIYSRSVWGAQSPRSRYHMQEVTDELWLHHAAGAEDMGNNGRWADDVKFIQKLHRNINGWSDIGYSFLADQSGQLWEGRGAHIAGGHTKGRNTVSHGVCAIGNFQEIEPSEELLYSLADLLVHGFLSGWWTARRYTGPHRNAPGASTACCGDNLIAAIPRIHELADEIRGVIADPKIELPNHDRASIESLYVTFAGREGDEDGIIHWMYSELSEDEIAAYLWKHEGLPKLWKHVNGE